MKSSARVLVIGGGVMGCSLLYHLARAGWTDAVLLEKTELTAGSTWHAAGLCTHYAHNATIMNLRAHSVALYRGELASDTGQPVSFHSTGALRITTRRDRLDEFRHVQGLGKFVGHDFAILSPDELKRLYPLVDTTGLVGAIHEPNDGYVDPSQATHAFAHGARSRGATIYRHTKVQGLRRHHGEWLVETDQGHIRCEHVVNAAGTWCREIGHLMGVDIPVVPMLHQYIVTDRIDAFADRDGELPMIRDPDESWYLRQEREGVIIGPYEKPGVPWSVDGVPPSFGQELLPPDLDRIESIALKCMARIPASGEGGIKTIVNGPITFTPDANPLIGPAFALRNAWLLTGSSMGVMEGGGAGQFLARWIIDGEPPADALTVDARRFGAYADRHYRVDKAVECFSAQFGIHYPYEERAAGRNKRASPVMARLTSLQAVFGSAYGWERPNYFAHNHLERTAPASFRRPHWFESVERECQSVRDQVGIADLSVFSTFEVAGPDSHLFVDTLGCNRAPSPGRLNLNLVLNRGGGVILEFSVTAIAPNRYRLIAAASAERIADDLLRHHGLAWPEAFIVNVSDSLCALGVMGPQAKSLLQALTDTDLSQLAFPWLSAQSMKVAGISVSAVRVSYVGENGWELHVERQHLLSLFDALRAAGRPYGVTVFGAFAMNAMRLEKGYRAWGSDYTTERTPLEAGMSRIVCVNGRDFVGRDAVLQKSEEHWSMQLLALEAHAVDPFYAHPVVQAGQSVGIVTSGAYGHRCKQSLALAYFNPGYCAEQPLVVELLGQPVSAQVLQTAPYDPNHMRCLA